MSLLTSDNSLKTSNLRKIIRYHLLISLVVYSLGLFYLLYLIRDASKTTFHDNSLLPGLANREFINSKYAENVVEQLKNATVHLPKNEMPVDFLLNHFKSIGLTEVFEHRFKFSYPFGFRKSTYEGVNIYAVFRAPRSSSTESIVLSTPYRDQSYSDRSTFASIGLILSLAKFFKTKNFWAKDIIYLISDNDLVGFQAWLQSYHGLNRMNCYLTSDHLIAKAGVIQAGINLELHSFNGSGFVDLKVEGLNGQLPNLDLFNVAVELSIRESMPPTFHGDSFYLTNDEWENWVRQARTIASMAVTQATMLPTGAHGLFQKYSISSITIENSERALIEEDQYSMNTIYLGRSIEGVVRSLNNMLEKFNRGFFFYLLGSTRRFISLSFYMIGFGLLALPLALRSLYYYFQALPNTDRLNQSTQATSFNFWVSFQPCFLAHLFGIAVLSIVPIVLIRLDTISNYFPWIESISVENLTISMILSLSFIALYPIGFLERRKFENQYFIQSMVALLNAALLFTCFSLINISLALGFCLVYVPMVAILGVQSTTHHSGWFVSILKRSILLLLHPFILQWICLTVVSIWMDKKFFKWNEIDQLVLYLLKHIAQARLKQAKVILNYIEHWYLFDNWAFPLVALTVFPVWLQFWFQSITLIIN